MKPKPFTAPRVTCRMLVMLWLAARLLGAAPGTHAQTAPPTLPWTVETLVTRSPLDGEPVTIAMALRLPEKQPVRHIALYVSPNDAPLLRTASGATHLELIGPWVRASAALNEQGVAVAFADSPSDAQGRALARREPTEVRRDIEVLVAHLQKRFAGVPVHLGVFSVGATATLDAAARIDGVARIVVASGAFLNARTRDWRAIGPRVLLIHAPSATCSATPFVDAQWVARKNGFALVAAGYETPAAHAECGRRSHHVLADLDDEFAAAVARWFDGAEPPDATLGIGHANPQIAWREQVVTYAAPGVIGVNQLEMTLLFPDGAGPFPVAVFNHGDVDIDSAFLRHRQRVRELPVALEFLRQGVAVAVPARRGVAMSEGNYPRDFARHDGDPTYKARVHAQDILPALDYLKTRSEIDAQRIILAGHSAGGYSASYIASTQPPGVIGAVNFSGGRTDATLYESAGALNRMMVSGFATLGKTTRLPSLWVFAENDTRYSANTIRAAHAAFVQAGGTAKLALSPPLAGDGHFIYHRPELWREALKIFLTEIGVVKTETVVER
jgi:dienelactone hydrolase